MNDFNKPRKKKLSPSEIKRYLGDAKQVARELKQYAKDCIYADNPDFRETYENKWIIVFENAVRATGPTLAKVMEKCDRLKLPRRSVVVKFYSIDEPPKRYFKY